MVAALEKNLEDLSPAEWDFLEFIGDRQHAWDAAIVAMKHGFDLCESPIEQQFYAQWLRVAHEFARSPRATKTTLGGWGLITEIISPFMWLTLSPQQNITIEERTYRIDFLLEIQRTNQPARHIAIELDGHDFHERTKEQATKDKSRDRLLARYGYTVLRFTGSEIFNNSREAVKDVLRTATALITK